MSLAGTPTLCAHAWGQHGAGAETTIVPPAAAEEPDLANCWSTSKVTTGLTRSRHKLRRMGTNGLKVPSDQLVQAAAQWQGLSAGLTSAAPSAGQPFQPTTAAISAIDAATGVGGAACMARIQDTAAKVTSAAAGYANQDASGQGQLAAVAPQVVMV